MNRRFLRWILNAAHATENRYSRYGHNIFSWAEPAVRWNSLMLVVFFTFPPIIYFNKVFTDHQVESLLTGILLSCLVICIWAVNINLRFFHRMRRRKLPKKAKQRTRWMLNHTPHCFGFLIMFSILALVGTSQEETSFQLTMMFVTLYLLIPYFGTRFWVVIATLPFHTCYKKR